MDAAELQRLLTQLGTTRVERKAAISDTDDLHRVICAFANDLPGSGLPGYLCIGLDDRGAPAGLSIDDRPLTRLSAMRDDGTILPIPEMNVDPVIIAGAQVAVVEVRPCRQPPVRFRGRVWVRVGPTTRPATPDEERRLTERHVAASLPFDARPCASATLQDLDLDAFQVEYLRKVIDQGVLAQNSRSLEQQLASLRFFNLREQCPTHAGILAFGKAPWAFLPGAYVQFTRYDGRDRAAKVVDHKSIRGRLIEQLRQLDAILPMQIVRPLADGPGLQRTEQPDYSLDALREFVMNGIMHRTYEGTNAPVQLYWFSDRVEVRSPGGLYGTVTPENFERVNDYRNPTVAEVMKGLGFVERFGSGIARAQAALVANRNPRAQFDFGDPSSVLVTLAPSLLTTDMAAKNRPSLPDGSSGSTESESPDEVVDVPDTDPPPNAKKV